MDYNELKWYSNYVGARNSIRAAEIVTPVLINPNNYRGYLNRSNLCDTKEAAQEAFDNAVAEHAMDIINIINNMSSSKSMIKRLAKAHRHDIINLFNQIKYITSTFYNKTVDG